MLKSWTPVHEQIAQLITRHTGLSIPEGRRIDLASAIPRGMRRTGEKHAGSYVERLARDETALEDLAADVTVGETYFFRDTRQFALIRDRILPDIRGRKAPQDGVRVWSAGCASGEEAHSLVITLQEAGMLGRAHVIGTDIARTRLEQARAGQYGRWSFRGVPDAVRDAYFRPEGRRFVLKRELRECAEFRYLNLAEDTYPSLSTGIWGFDLVLCRNVLIYFEPAVVQRVLRGLIDSLAENGWLLLGASDPTHEVLRRCRVITTPAGLAYQKTQRAALESMPVPVPATPVPPVRHRADPAPARKPAPLRVQVTLADVERAYAAHDYDAAVRLAWRIPAHQAPARVWAIAIRSHANQGSIVEAERACSAALDRHPADAELLYLQAVLLTETAHYEPAIRAARQALYLEPRFVVAHLALGTACARAGQREGAQRAFRNAERLLASSGEQDEIPAADGEPAGRLLSIARAQLRLASAGGDA